MSHRNRELEYEREHGEWRKWMKGKVEALHFFLTAADNRLGILPVRASFWMWSQEWKAKKQQQQPNPPMYSGCLLSPGQGKLRGWYKMHPAKEHWVTNSFMWLESLRLADYIPLINTHRAFFYWQTADMLNEKDLHGESFIHDALRCTTHHHMYRNVDKHICTD